MHGKNGWIVANQLALYHTFAGYDPLKDNNMTLLTDKKGVAAADIVKRQFALQYTAFWTEKWQRLHFS
ncbi:MAG: hypothetical protein KGH64_00505 [Candidatus Micrarchaeota archaeon]|nr:hypothetical protein [Candidatus Micrarchaeota archaeon]MDE1833797.1 hypothetical protein [Candidatus Micrarchaeota archaeon]MDE1859593.1 hypothetical protein [Candidatus Micrarchaeota archaeon]